MNIVSLLNKDTVIPDLHAEDKEDLLNKLIDTLRTQVSESDLSLIRKAVLEREKIMSTGVGKGLAIPHGKAKGLDDNYAAFAILSEAVDYNSIDDRPVKMVFLLVGPETQNSLHIKLLSRISRLMNNEEFREQLNNCVNAEQIIETFKMEENQYSGIES